VDCCAEGTEQGRKNAEQEVEKGGKLMMNKMMK
jgi:hypothetical protein